MGVGIDIDRLQEAIEEKLTEYGDYIYKITEEGLDAAQKILLADLKASSPKSAGGGKYAKSWKSKGKKYKFARYVGNTKVVKGKKGDVPLSNILEYSEKSPYQGRIKQTYNTAVPKMVDAIVKSIKEG